MKYFFEHRMNFSTLIISLFIFFILSACNKEDNQKINNLKNTEPQTITSTINGGVWSNPSTWIENLVPTEKNDVIISGRVNIKTPVQCLNLMIDNGAILEVEKDAKIKVIHHFINEGIVINNGTIVIPDDE